MRSRLIFIAISLLFGILSCEKYKNTNDSCADKVLNDPNAILITAEELNLVKNLFETNSIDYSRIQFYKFQTSEPFKIVRCYQFINNLKIFTENLNFIFDKYGNYLWKTGDLITEIDLDTISMMKQSSLIEKYLDELVKDDNFFGDKEEIIKGCFEIEFGYYDLNSGKGFTENNFTKAWKLKPLGNEYPFAYINDMTSNIIFYDNGIRY